MSFLEIRALEKSCGDHAVLSGVNLLADEAEVPGAKRLPESQGKKTAFSVFSDIQASLF